MKKIFAMVALMLVTLTVSAQDDAKYTIKAGAGASSIVGADADTNMKFAFKVGASYDLSLSENFSIIPGLELAFKGYGSDIYSKDVNMGYLEVPIFAAYKFPLTDNMKLAVKAGPYVAVGLFGSELEFGNMKFGIFDSEYGYSRFDVGAIGGVSLEFEKFMVGVEYSRSLKKLDSDFSQYNQAFGAVFGYKF